MLPFPPLEHPIVQAPMAGGPSTPELAIAVSNAGGLGFLAAGYTAPDRLREQLQRVREATPRPFGLNLFVPSPDLADAEALRRYAASLAPEAARLGVTLGASRYDDDAWADKLALAVETRVPVVSFTFGCPGCDVIERLHAHGIAVWITVTELEEARVAERAGADALVLQGFEAGGHRGTFADRDGAGEIALLPLLRLVARESGLPLIAAGGICDGAALAALLVAGARAGQLGSAFMLCPEAATSPPHRAALASGASTGLTRAFTGRRARGIVNRFQAEHAGAPSGYPQIGNVTQPLRAAARAAGDGDGINLWAGQAHALAEAVPAGELVRRFSADARLALEGAVGRLGAR